MYTPKDVTKKPTISMKLKTSFINTQAIIAETGGTKKNRVEDLLTDPSLIKNIKIVKAPKETNII